MKISKIMRQQFRVVTGCEYINSQGEIDIDYVYYLEQKLQIAMDGLKEINADRYGGCHNTLPGKIFTKVIAISEEEEQQEEDSQDEAIKSLTDFCNKLQIENTQQDIVEAEKKT